MQSCSPLLAPMKFNSSEYLQKKNVSFSIGFKTINNGIFLEMAISENVKKKEKVLPLCCMITRCPYPSEISDISYQKN